MKNALNKYTHTLFNKLFLPRSIYFLSSFIFLINAGCNKSNEATQLTPNYDIYMAGTMEGKAVYWKNGVPIILSDSGVAYSIAISGSDIYACGTITKGYKEFATYWKNGKEIPLDNLAWSEATGIAIQGEDIYFSGCIVGPDSVTKPVYWKNGRINYLSPGSKGSTRGILVSDQNVYISGYTYGTSSDSAIVWKNGEKVFFGEYGFMNTVGFNGTDTFFLGTLIAAPTYWVNNKMTKLYYNGFLETVAFSGADVYFGGGVRPNLDDNYAAIWKNDSLTILTDQYTNSAVSGIAIAGTDVYAVGHVNDDFIYLSPVYWKNGVMIKLGNKGLVYGISIDH